MPAGGESHACLIRLHPRVFGLESPLATCPLGSVSITAPPMLHVWIVPNPGGPFAIDLDPSVTDAYGFPVARITYEHHPNDYEVAATVIPRLSQLLSEMGAESTEAVFPFAASTSIPQPGPTGGGQRGPGRSAPDPIGGLVNHQMGTMRMGGDPDTSVVDSDQRFHGIPNLYAIDGSVFPTASGVNPMLTIYGIANRAAKKIAARLS